MKTASEHEKAFLIQKVTTLDAPLDVEPGVRLPKLTVCVEALRLSHEQAQAKAKHSSDMAKWKATLSKANKSLHELVVKSKESGIPADKKSMEEQAGVISSAQFEYMRASARFQRLDGNRELHYLPPRTRVSGLTPNSVHLKLPAEPIHTVKLRN